MPKPLPLCTAGCGKIVKARQHTTCGDPACVAFRKAAGHAPAAREKAASKMRGRPRPAFSQEWRDNIAASVTGVKQSDETRAKHSANMTERYLDPQQRLNTARAITLARSGRTTSRTEFLGIPCPICQADATCPHKRSAWAWFMSMDEYVSLFRRGCPCQRPLPVVQAETSIIQRIAVDHDHSHKCIKVRGRNLSKGGCRSCIRGLMHQNCNVALGMAGDSPEVLRKLADYLENPVTLDTQDHS
jgi:hypothetical protein